MTRTCGTCGEVHPIPARPAPVPARDPWLCKKCSHQRWVQANGRPVGQPPGRALAGCSRDTAQRIVDLLRVDPGALVRWKMLTRERLENRQSE